MKKIFTKIKQIFTKIKQICVRKIKQIILLFLILLLTPIILNQMSNKIERTIYFSTQEAIQNFEKQTGLKIKWVGLEFKILTLTVQLKDVTLEPITGLADQKKEYISFFDGLQSFKKISVRPSLFTFLFQKEIFISKLTLEGGDIYLKEFFSSLKNNKEAKGLRLPIKNFFIKNTNINLTHKNYTFRFFKIKSTVVQKKQDGFWFDLNIKEVHAIKDLALKPFQGFGNISGNDIAEKREEPFSLSLKGSADKKEFHFENINLKNKKFEALVKDLDVHFDLKGIKKLYVKSSGSLPFSFLQKGFDLLGKKFIFFKSLLVYDLNLQYRKNKGVQGTFEIQGKDSLFKTNAIKNFYFKGKFFNYLVTIDQGLIEKEQDELIKIKKAEWIFKRKPSQFNFSLQVKNISSSVITATFFSQTNFPVKGNFTGFVHCFGLSDQSYLKCESKGQTGKITLEDQDSKREILSFYKMDLDFNLEWKDQLLSFTNIAKKENSIKMNLEGNYSEVLDELKLDYSFVGNLSQDVKLNVPLSLEGDIKVEKGQVHIQNGFIKAKGYFNSPLLKIQNNRLKNISGDFHFEDNKLQFLNVRGTPNKTSYFAEGDIDFRKDQLILKLKIPFFDLQDALYVIKDQYTPPVKVKGTGEVSLFLLYPWSSPKQKSIYLTGNLFNFSLDEDLFQQASVNLNLQSGKGVVNSISLRKGQGFINGTGIFNENFVFDMNLTGQNLSLERMEFLNKILPFNQSGDVNFKMKVTGDLVNPKLTSHINISNMFFYSQAVKDTQLKIFLDKKALSFSGNIANEINIKKFIYPFSKISKLEMTGDFTSLDFIKIFLSRNRLVKKENYKSKISGSFSFSQNLKTKVWAGFSKIHEFVILKSNKWIKSEKTFSVFFQDNKWSLTSSVFSHHDNKKLILEKKGQNKITLSGESYLSLFSVFFPFLKEFEGNIQAQLVLENNLKQLNPKGFLKIDNGLTSISTLPEFTNVSTFLVFVEDNIFIKDLKSDSGGGLLEGEGTVFYDFINAPVVNLKLNFQEMAFNIPEDFNTNGSGEIEITGTKPPYLISGQYRIDSGNIIKNFSGGSKQTTYNFSFLDKEIKKQPSIFKLQLNINTKQAVDVNSSLIRSSIEGSAEIYGLLNNLLLNGRFVLSKNIEENLIFFRGQEFKIDSGSIAFTNSPADNPYLNIKANTKFKETIVNPLESNQEIERIYDILLSLKGYAKDPNILLKSFPPLKEKELISLLTLGIGSRRFDANVKQDVTDYSYQLLGSLLLENSLNREIKNTLGVDFRLTPYINTLNKPVTKITLSKNWFKKWKTSFSRTIEDAQSDFHLKYNLNQQISLTAFWENTGEIQLVDSQKDLLGLDFEFNFDF